LKNLAINTYSYCLKFYPTNYAIWHNLGALESDKNYQKAYDYFSKAIEINPSHLPSFLGKIKTAIKMHKDSK
jgi:tetratricopeptide (TPR) repeat protein